MSTDIRPSCEEIEMLCMFYAIAEESRSAATLTERLGLAKEHEHLVQSAVLSLVAMGYVEMGEEVFTATDEGRAWMTARVSLFLSKAR